LADKNLYPFKFCVSIHEHCWLLDHGVWGKEKYLKEFWDVLNWNKVEERYASFRAKNAGPQPINGIIHCSIYLHRSTKYILIPSVLNLFRVAESCAIGFKHGL
jgi:hypothetical protein